MKPPRPFKFYKKRGYSRCIACDEFKLSNNIFFHEGTTWTLCLIDYNDYWENTDGLLPDYKDFDFWRHW